MLNLFESLETSNQSSFLWMFVVYFTFFLFCDFGKATIVAYDGNLDVEEFPDIELSFTQPIKRNGIEGALVTANPLHACDNISRPPDKNDSINWFVLMSGNSCNFETKVLNARIAGYSLGIIYTYRARVERTSTHGHYRFYSDMPAVVVKTEHGIKLKDNYLFTINNRYRIVVFPNNSFSIMTFLLLFSIVAGLFLVIMLAFTVIRFFQQSSSSHNGRLSSQHLRQLQITIYQKGGSHETCAICLEDYKDQDKLRILPCSHAYHMKCIDPWLTNNRRICPVCKRKVNLVGESSSSSMSQSHRDRSETTPLLQAGRLDPHGTFNFVNTSAANNLSSSLPAGCGTLHSTHHTAEPPDRQDDRYFV